jgi:hypothetical protein
VGEGEEVFLVGLAVLNLMSAVAERQPLDLPGRRRQWLDSASRTVLTLVARRLRAESLGLVLATRAAGGDLAGLPELEVGGLGEAEAGAARRGAPRADRCAGSRPDRRRDSRQPAGAAGAAPDWQTR